MKIRTANKDARWSVVIRKRFGVLIIFDIRARCPELEIGRNSVAA